jgi:uncharacterized protein YjiS (DUF1127 family)
MNSIPATGSASSASTRGHSFLFAITDQLSHLGMALDHWRRQQQTSMQLGHVDAHTLRDVGISESRRFIEINKPL